MFSLEIGDGADALTFNQILQFLRGYAVVSGAGGGCQVTVGTGAMEVDVASGTVIHGGSAVSVTATTKTLAAGGDLPRKDTIWVDGTGTVNVTQGTEAAAKPQNATREDTFQPEPDDLTGSNAVVLAVVWVASDYTDLAGAADIQDRRVMARVPNEVIEGLQNLGASDAFSQYPLSLATDTEASAFPLVHGTDVDAPTNAHHNRDHQARHQQGGADEIATGSLQPQDPTAHAASHKDGGSDELDAAELAGALGTTGQVLTSDGAAASWEDADSGLGLEDFAFESGSFSFGGYAGTTSVSFTNSYERGIIMAGANLSDYTDHCSVYRSGWNTDGSGNITGADLRWDESNGGGNTMYWDMFGIVQQ